MVRISKPMEIKIRSNKQILELLDLPESYVRKFTSSKLSALIMARYWGEVLGISYIDLLNPNVSLGLQLDNSFFLKRMAKLILQGNPNITRVTLNPNCLPYPADRVYHVQKLTLYIQPPTLPLLDFCWGKFTIRQLHFLRNCLCTSAELEQLKNS